MKIAVAQLNYIIGDVEGNAKKILDVINERRDDVDLILFTELALTGYYPQDLLFSRPVREAQDKALQQIAKATEGARAAVVIGCYTDNPFKGKPFYNSIKLFADGVEAWSYDKKLLPTYNIFEEARHFEPGRRNGTVLFKGLKLGFLLCEDGWGLAENGNYNSNPVEDLRNENLDLIISINASPSNLGKQTQRRLVFKDVALACRAPIVYTNQTGGNDEIVFDGASFALDRTGAMNWMMPSFEEATNILEFNKDCSTPEECFKAIAGFDSSEIRHDGELMFKQTVMGIRDYVEKINAPGIVIGSSGGIDSAVTLAIAAKAVGADRVKAITMPSKYSSAGSVDDSVELCKNLGVELFTHPIRDEFELCTEGFKNAFSMEPSGLTQENIQARLRGRILMEYSNHTGFLVVSTGNKSEMAAGYATLYGDMNGGVNPLGDLYKLDVYAVARWFNSAYPDSKIPVEIIEKAPSAELAPGQQDTDSLPPYEIMDAILKLYIESDLLPTIDRDVYVSSLRGTANETIERVCGLVDRAEFKRRQAPPIIRVQRRSFGTGRHLPIVAKYPNIKSLGDLVMMFS